MRVTILKHLDKMEFVCGLKQFKEYSKEDAVELLDCLEALFRSFGWITDARIDYIMKAGLRGEYGEFYHVNERTVNTWIRTYFLHHQSDIIRENLEKSHKSEEVKSEEEIQYWIEIGKDHFRSLFEESRNTMQVAHIAEWGIYWFAKMQDKGLLKPWKYPVDTIEEEIRKELRLTTRYVEETSVAAKTKNKIWRLFILECVKDKIQLDKII